MKTDSINLTLMDVAKKLSLDVCTRLASQTHFLFVWAAEKNHCPHKNESCGQEKNITTLAKRINEFGS